MEGAAAAPQTQEIPLLLLHGSVVAACLCVYFCGTDPASMCQRGQAGGGGGGWLTVPRGRLTYSPTAVLRDAQEKLNKQPRPFSQDTSRHSYWLTHWAALCFSLVPPPPAPLFKGDLEVWPLNFDPFGKAGSVPEGAGSRRRSSVECLDSGCAACSAGVTAR